jgi:hypothetical protein
MNKSISITRALAELKLLNKRIEKSTNSKFISCKENGKQWLDHIELSKSNWQSVNDLINRYNKMKFAILKSNYETCVIVGKQKYSVVEAIIMKTNICYKKELLDELKRQKMCADNMVVSFETKLQQKIDNIIETNFSSSGEKNNGDIANISELYKKTNFIEVVDPLKLDTKIAELEQEIDEFETNIDFCLSESNAKTLINV